MCAAGLSNFNSSIIFARTEASSSRHRRQTNRNRRRTTNRLIYSHICINCPPGPMEKSATTVRAVMRVRAFISRTPSRPQTLELAIARAGEGWSPAATAGSEVMQWRQSVWLFCILFFFRIKYSRYQAARFISAVCAGTSCVVNHPLMCLADVSPSVNINRQIKIKCSIKSKRCTRCAFYVCASTELVIAIAGALRLHYQFKSAKAICYQYMRTT